MTSPAHPPLPGERRRPTARRAPAWLAALALLGPGGAHSAGWGGAVGGSSDTVARGVTRTGGEPGTLLAVHHTTDTGWAAAFNVTVVDDPGPRSSSYAIASLSRGWQLDEAWSTRTGLARYAYPGGDKRFGPHDYSEVFSSVDWKGRLSASVGMAFNASHPTMRGRVENFRTYELTTHHRLVGQLGVDAGVGYADFGSPMGRGYRFQSAGLSWGLGNAQVFFSRVGNNAVRRGVMPGFIAEPRWIGSVLWNF